MCFRSYVGRGFGANWKGVIFDVEYKPLEDIITQAKQLYLNLGDGCRWVGGSSYWFVWSTGEKLLFRAVKSLDSASGYLGHGYSFVGYNELSKWPDSLIYDYLMGSMRASSNSQNEIPTYIFNTTNPWGPGTPWIKKRFIDPTGGQYGQMIKREFEIPTLEGKRINTEHTLIAMMGSFTENPYIPAKQLANLWASVEHSPNRKRAWLYCDWDVVYDEGAIGAHWKTDIHVVPNFDIPTGWKLNRAMDWGSTAPFAIGWFAESNGEEFEHEGQTYCYPRGTVVMFYEWYGARAGTSLGLKMSAEQIAFGVKRRESQLATKGIIKSVVRPGPADNQISNVNEVNTPTIERQMARHGVRWTQSNKGTGTRIHGLQAITQALQNSIAKEGPGLYFQRRCKHAIEQLPTLEGEGEDIKQRPPQEDHIYDMLRYRMLLKSIGAPKVGFRYH